MMRFKNNLLRLLMAERGYSTYDLRDALARRGVKVTVQAIYSWRQGRTEPSGKALSALCDVFGIEAPGWFEKVSEKEVRDEDKM
jgi:transcriptional regulator with XRE-family HTH domain